MTVTVRSQDHLAVPASVQRKADIKAGDRLEFKVFAGVITITSPRASGYEPTKSEHSRIR